MTVRIPEDKMVDQSITEAEQDYSFSPGHPWQLTT
jgi:hypothetical protein